MLSGFAVFGLFVASLFQTSSYSKSQHGTNDETHMQKRERAVTLIHSHHPYTQRETLTQTETYRQAAIQTDTQTHTQTETLTYKLTHTDTQQPTKANPQRYTQ